MAAHFLQRIVMARKYGSSVVREIEPEETVTYLNRVVPREGFRAFIYSTDGRTKIAESYDEFDLFVHSDEWFATKEEAQIPKKPRKKTEG